MDRVITHVATSAADRLVQRQREAFARLDARLRREVAALAPAHPARPALRAAMRDAERHWEDVIAADIAAEAAAHAAGGGCPPTPSTRTGVTGVATDARALRELREYPFFAAHGDAFDRAAGCRDAGP